MNRHPSDADATENATENAIAAMSFETALNQLETIVSRLEKGDVELEKAIDLYERGEKLKARCEALLASAEERIEAVIGARGEGDADLKTDDAL